MTECPTCGSHELREVELAGGAEFRADVSGRVPEQGDTIIECGVCRDFTVKPRRKSSSSRPAAKPKPKSPAKPKSKRRRLPRVRRGTSRRGTS